jgi:hypothetical protein
MIAPLRVNKIRPRMLSFGETGNVIETHELKGDFKERSVYFFYGRRAREELAIMQSFNAYSLYGAGNSLQDAI